MSNSNLDDCMDLTDPEEKAYYDSILGDDIIEPDYWASVKEPDYVGDVGEFDRLERLKKQSSKTEFFASDDFKQAEQIRREASKPSTHTPVDFNRVWCPVYSKVRPEWLCFQEHEADVHEVLDEDWSSDES